MVVAYITCRKKISSLASLPDPIPEAEIQTVFLDAGKASRRRRRVLLSVLCFIMLCSCLLVVYSYWSHLKVVSYGSCPSVPFEASHTRSVRLLVTVKTTLGSQTEAPLLTAITAIILLHTLFLGAAPPCESTTTGSTYHELVLAGSGCLCRYKAHPPLIATSTCDETPPYCIATFSIWSPDPSTIPISNRCLSSTLVMCLDGLGLVVYSVFVTAPAHQGPYGENPYRKNLLTSPAKTRLRPPRLPLRPYPGVYKRPLSIGVLSPVVCGEADPFSENGVGELLPNKTLICSLLAISWAWTWLQLVGHSSILRCSKALSFYRIFISKFRRFRPLLFSVKAHRLQHGPSRVLSPTISFPVGFDNTVFASVIEPALHQRQGVIGDKLFQVDLLTSLATTGSCPLCLNLPPHLGSETEKGQFAPPLPCAFTTTNRRNTPKSCARRLDRTETRCLLPVACSSVLLKGKLAFEIHLVSLRSFVEFRTDLANFSVKSSPIGLNLGVAQGPGASHQELLLGNSPTVSYWCINVDFDYQLFLRTIALEIKVKLLHGVLHLAELDSPLIGFIFLCFVMLSTFVVPSSMTPGSFVSAVQL